MSLQKGEGSEEWESGQAKVKECEHEHECSQEKHTEQKKWVKMSQDRNKLAANKSKKAHLSAAE